MGLEVNLRWRNQTRTERRAQWSPRKGWLDHNYGGGKVPSPIYFLFHQCFDTDTDRRHYPRPRTSVDATELEQRLVDTCALAIAKDVVETRRPNAAAFLIIPGNGAGPNVVERIRALPKRQRRRPKHLLTAFSDTDRARIREAIDLDCLHRDAQRYVDFVKLAVRKQAETGQHVTIAMG